VVNHAILTGSLQTVFGWHVHVDNYTRTTTLLNFPMQGNGAEMFRIACVLAVRRGIPLCAPVHDATMIIAPIDRIDGDAAKMAAIMAEASRVVLNGFELRTEIKIVRWPDRYEDDRGVETWTRIMQLLDIVESSEIRLAAE
jgi:DNA polymerase-1